MYSGDLVACNNILHWRATPHRANIIENIFMSLHRHAIVYQRHRTLMRLDICSLAGGSPRLLVIGLSLGIVFTGIWLLLQDAKRMLRFEMTPGAVRSHIWSMHSKYRNL